MPQKKDKGTRYTPREREQRSYFLTPGLGDFFRDFNNGNASTGARGAFILWMACRKFPDLRERAVRAADQMEFKDAVETVEKLLIEEVGLHAFREWAKALPEGERAKILAQARARK